MFQVYLVRIYLEGVVESVKKNYIYAAISVFIWSTMAAVVKSLLSAIPSLEALAVSSLFAFLFLLAVNIGNGTIRELKNYTVKTCAVMSGLGFLGLFLYSALYYYGLSQLTSQEACILNYLWPMMLVLFSCLILREKVTGMKIAAMVCSFIGILILSMGGGRTEENAMLGMLACILAAACYGLFSVLNKKADLDQGITMMVIWLTTAVCSMLLGMVTETWVPVRGVQWVGILWLGVMSDAVAYLLWALALAEAEHTAAIANLAYLTPFLSLIISAVFLKEKIQIQAVAALVFIIGGIFLQGVSEHRKQEES